MITPALKALKRNFPFIQLTVALDRHRTKEDIYFNLIKNAYFIDSFEDARFIDRNDYDHIVDISAVCIPYERKELPPRNRIDIFLDYLGLVNVEDKLPFYKVEKEESLKAKEFLRLNSKKTTLIGLHTASNDLKRSWPKNRQLEFIKFVKLSMPKAEVLIFDQNNIFKEDIENSIIISNSSVREMAALINECDYFVGPDSGPMHIAGALSIPSLVVFGSIPPKARINYYSYHSSVVLDKLNCLGCWYNKCDIEYKCMKDLSGTIVGNKFLSEYLKLKKV